MGGILAISDDITEEDMFRALPQSALTIKVGHQASSAKFNIPTQQKVIDLLRELN
jgi:trehalose 6-phosphate synthase/phosphatase